MNDMIPAGNLRRILQLASFPLIFILKIYNISITNVRVFDVLELNMHLRGIRMIFFMLDNIE